ncbi:MAG: GLPGLI family protein [Flavobacterium sp.]|nr:GLPGLI family protein [Flavobacterium sp.]
MKNLFFILLLCSFCFGQQKRYRATYELTRSKNNFKFTAQGVTDFDSDKKVSVFKLSQYDNLLKNGKKIFDKEENDSIVVLGSNSICLDNKTYFFDFKSNESTFLLFNVNCKSRVLINEKIFYPKWEIKDEFKTISGYKTQKATAFINDRTWTVYFTKEIKQNIAPWRLIGLPGTIIEAYENTSVYSFKLEKIENISDNINIEAPKYKVKSSFVDFVDKSVKQNKEEMIFKLSQIEDAIIDETDINMFPLYETLDFIEKRAKK